MDPRSQSDSDGGGGRRGRSSPDAPHDEGRPQARTPQDADGPPPRAPPVLSLDQIRVTGSSNEYTEGPAAAQRSPGASPGPRGGGPREAREERPNNLRDLNPSTRHGNADASASSDEGAPRPPSAAGSQGSVGTSVGTSAGSASSGQRLLGGEQIIRTQPKRSELNSEELKPLNRVSGAGSGSGAVAVVPGSGAPKGPAAHSNRCEDCGRCRCPECRRPRALPSRWVCGRRCMCSAQSAVEYGTCVCCVKGLFYHCSSDDEDTCADKPFSCAQSHCRARWAAVSLLSLVLPCLLCYLPAKGCAAACQSCYDRATRPGCRCKNPKALRREDAGKPT
ncbi:protein sprouty homolog 2 [Brachyistius frenatus]|uniref:protein sprouty homolog 2 n=1 Tax=Brachyistius frenatus TaxID=100188 RepID=UPI0037E759B0